MPGISPFQASSLKQIRQTLKRRRKPLGRPQILQRLCCRTGNLGFNSDFITNAFLAIISSYAACASTFLIFVKGIPNNVNNSSVCSLGPLLKTKVMSIPC